MAVLPLPMALRPFMDPSGFYIELIFTVFAVFFCMLIYFRTKESYDLTKYRGIKYFRTAFLFLGISYLLRFLLGLVLLSVFTFDFFFPRLTLLIFILPLSYLSTIGIFYLIFSLIWKRFDNRSLLLFGHCIAIVLSVAALVTRSHEILFLFQLMLLVMTVVLSFFIKGKKLSHTRVLYLLVFVLWLMNLWATGRKRLPIEIEVLFYILSLFVFGIVYLRISRWVR